MTNKTNKNKYVFVLKKVDTDKLDQMYHLCSLKQDKNNIPNNVTKLSDLSNRKHEVISFLDDSKKTHTANLFMVDLNNINHSKQYHCFWDHHPIGNNFHIGCPIEYTFSQGVRRYISEISIEFKYTNF